MISVLLPCRIEQSVTELYMYRLDELSIPPSLSLFGTGSATSIESTETSDMMASPRILSAEATSYAHSTKNKRKGLYPTRVRTTRLGSHPRLFTLESGKLQRYFNPA